MKIKVLEFTRKPRKGLEKTPYFDIRKATIEITKKPFLWFMEPKVSIVEVYKPHANWKYQDTGTFCDMAIDQFLDAYDELNEP